MVMPNDFPRTVHELHLGKTRCPTESHDHATRSIDQSRGRIGIRNEHHLCVHDQEKIHRIRRITVHVRERPLKSFIALHESLRSLPIIHEPCAIQGTSPFQRLQIGLIDEFYLSPTGKQKRRTNRILLPVQPLTGLKNRTRGGGQCAHTRLFQHLLKHHVSLAVNMGQFHGVKDPAFPDGGLKGKSGGIGPAIHGRQLTEVAHEKHLEAAEGTTISANLLTEFVQFVEKFGSHHGDFINDQEISQQPMLQHFSVSADFGMEFGDGPFSDPNAGPGVNGFGLVAEEKGSAPSQGAQLDAWKGVVGIRGKLLSSFHSWIGGIHERKEKTFTDASTACEEDIMSLEEILEDGGLLLGEPYLLRKRWIVRHDVTSHGHDTWINF